MTKRLQPIRLDAYKPLREVVSETLRQAIQDGVLKPGERLMEIPLAEELGREPHTIREAIRKLELEALSLWSSSWYLRCQYFFKRYYPSI